MDAALQHRRHLNGTGSVPWLFAWRSPAPPVRLPQRVCSTDLLLHTVRTRKARSSREDQQLAASVSAEGKAVLLAPVAQVAFW